MNLSFYIAQRYLFSKKTHNAINIISMVAVCGVAVATLAAVCTLSVFNGFQGLVSNMFSSFDPELKIVPVTGKVFDPQAAPFLEVYSLPEIELISETLEDNVLVKHRERQVPVVMKGVSDNFNKSTSIEDVLYDGEYKLYDEINVFTVLGIGVASNLGINASFSYPLEIYAPKRNAGINLANPLASLHMEYAYIAGVFMIEQPQYDENYMIVSLDFARDLFEYENEVSALEIKVKPGYNIASLQKKIIKILGEEYEVKDRYQQQEATFKMMSIEKWVSFLMLCFIILIATFNIIGSLSMLIVDKQKDIQTLRNLGANNSLISRIFLFEGWLIAVVGALIGIVLGILLCWGQSYFGWIKLGSSEGVFAVNAYPVIVEGMDILLIFISVVLLGFIAVLYPVKYLSRKWL
ncbi:FtsX-like permease family protein [Bacteroidales bacterium OttesenSCG-928-M06]|nr:FtsX-like permease family protein [Bacteroidales bacterium OttesenSCG-928-M06]